MLIYKFKLVKIIKQRSNFKMYQKSDFSKKNSKKFSRNKTEKIRKIIETTFNLIEKKGYDGVSTNHIAAESKISIGTIYRYFPEGKPAIIQAVAIDMYDKFPIQKMIQSIDTNNVQDFISNLVEYYIQYHRENFTLMKATDKATLSSSIVRHEIDAFIKQVLQKLLKNTHKLPIFAQFKAGELENKLIIILKTIDSIIHRHLFFSPFFDTDKELTSFLVKLSLRIIEI